MRGYRSVLLSCLLVSWAAAEIPVNLIDKEPDRDFGRVGRRKVNAQPSFCKPRDRILPILRRTNAIDFQRLRRDQPLSVEIHRCGIAKSPRSRLAQSRVKVGPRSYIVRMHHWFS